MRELSVFVNVFDRFEDLVRTSVSLISSNLPENTEIVFLDDFSTDDRVEKYLSILEKDHRYDIYYHLRPEKAGRPYCKVIKSNFDILKSLDIESKYYLIIDSDVIFSYDWWNSFQQLDKDTVEQFGDVPRIISPYNGRISETHKPAKHFGTFTQKARTGCPALGIPGSHLASILEYEPVLTRDSGEAELFEHLRGLGGVATCAKPSKMEHIGDVSLLNHYHRDGSVDKAIGFDDSGDSLELYGEENDKNNRYETLMARSRLQKFCKGRGLDAGCGPFPLNDTCLTIDLQQYHKNPVSMIRDATDLSFLESETQDYVYSSHCLEDVSDPILALKEWIRVLKKGGKLVIYMPDKDYYFNVGHPKANKDHVKDYRWEDIYNMMANMPVELIYANRFGPVYKFGEWSFELVVRKTDGNVPKMSIPVYVKSIIPVTKRTPDKSYRVINSILGGKPVKVSDR